MKYLSNSVDILDVDVSLLKDNGINLIGDLYRLSRKDLKVFGYKDSEINLISIKLQLLGLDLNGKKYNL